MAYEQRLVGELTEEYIKTGSDNVFGRLTNAIIPIIDVQLGKQYSSMKGFWDDIRQDVLLKICENKESIKYSLTKNSYQYFYRRIRDWLNRSCEKYRGYDFSQTSKINEARSISKPKIVSLDSLKEDPASMRERGKHRMTPLDPPLAYNEWGKIVKSFGERRGIYHKNLKSV